MRTLVGWSEYGAVVLQFLDALVNVVQDLAYLIRCHAVRAFLRCCEAARMPSHARAWSGLRNARLSALRCPSRRVLVTMSRYTSSPPRQRPRRGGGGGAG